MHRGAPLFQASEMQRAQSWRERPAHVHLRHFLQGLYLKAQGAAVQAPHEKKSSWDQSTALQIIWNHKASRSQDKFFLSMNLTTQDRTSSVQSLSHVWLFVTPWTAAHQASCPSPLPVACSNSCPLSQWSHPTISSSVVPFSSRL